MAPPDSAGLMARRIGRWGRVLVAAPSVEAPEQASALEPRCLLGHISAAGALRPWALVCGEARAEVTPGGPLRSNSLEALLSACEQGMGIALLPGWLVEPSLAAGRLVRVAPGWSGEEVELWALHPAQLRWSARVRLCLELLARDAPQGQQNMP
jgi:DNA-binding transcriptional LysR family regulator